MARPRLSSRPAAVSVRSAMPDNGRALGHAVRLFIERHREAASFALLGVELGGLYAETVAGIERLKAAIAEGAFSMAFQPILALANRRPHHHEALLRLTIDWPTAEAIHFAERVGLIEALDLAVVDKVIAMLHRRPEVRVAVNLSGSSLENPAFAASLEGVLGGHRALAGRLLLEITETSEIRELVQVNRVVQRVRQAGFQVCLDDFGSGANAFHYLRAFAVDMVKIDGLYTRSALKEPTDRAFLKAMVGLCRDLGVATVAEMIETEAQAALIAELGVAFGQGYLFGRPVAEEHAFSA
jgi:EAL domain-containing protein (putative c-di-GMP-specific phosphodiesterase class I)